MLKIKTTNSLVLQIGVPLNGATKQQTETLTLVLLIASNKTLAKLHNPCVISTNVQIGLNNTYPIVNVNKESISPHRSPNPTSSTTQLSGPPLEAEVIQKDRLVKPIHTSLRNRKANQNACQNHRNWLATSQIPPKEECSGMAFTRKTSSPSCNIFIPLLSCSGSLDTLHPMTNEQ